MPHSPSSSASSLLSRLQTLRALNFQQSSIGVNRNTRENLRRAENQGICKSIRTYAWHHVRGNGIRMHECGKQSLESGVGLWEFSSTSSLRLINHPMFFALSMLHSLHTFGNTNMAARHNGMECESFSQT
uniref:Uncharacterized protein n=1 Tax=Craspedostauros australis TaxID=1486917 RepID=A0A7R9WQY6_9STRA|mmetsp:Transcript_14287/g.39377  ORF Transcript_14287/g.39377 Transcript_14287/m.39377 type:complete len:130 (+) Transcript_14287:828-1217(+)